MENHGASEESSKEDEKVDLKESAQWDISFATTAIELANKEMEALLKALETWSCADDGDGSNK